MMESVKDDGSGSELSEGFVDDEESTEEDRGSADGSNKSSSDTKTPISILTSAHERTQMDGSIELS